MSLSAYERGLLRNSHTRRCRVKFGLFDAPTEDFSGQPTGSTNMATSQRNLALISPRYSLVAPGESVSLYGGDSYVRGGGAATGHTWSLESGSAILAPSGVGCVVTPTGGEGSTVQVRLTVGTGGTANYAIGSIYASTNGWGVPTGTLELDGKLGTMGWSGRMEIAGDSAVGLEQGKLVLVHIDTWYDGTLYTMGGYKRANNLCLLRVNTWTYVDDPDGHKIARIVLDSPGQTLQAHSASEAAGELDGDSRFFIFEKSASAGYTNRYRADFRCTDASLFLAANLPVCHWFNVTVFHDSAEYDALRVDIGPLFDQLASPNDSRMGISLVDFAGSIMLIPHPAIRADEWWGTPDPLCPADDPLSLADCNREIRYYPNYHPTGRPWDGVIISGYDAEGAASKATTGGGSGDKLINTDLSGYAGPSADWAEDYLAFINREWDVTTTHFCPGNAFNLGNFAYLSLSPQQGGQPVVADLAYVTSIRHLIDIGQQMQTTQIEWSQATGALA